MKIIFAIITKVIASITTVIASILTQSILIILILLFFTGTELGLNCLFFLSNPFLPGQLHIQELHGSLMTGIQVSDLQWKINQFLFKIEEGKIAFLPCEKNACLFNWSLVSNDNPTYQLNLNGNLMPTGAFEWKGTIEEAILTSMLTEKWVLEEPREIILTPSFCSLAKAEFINPLGAKAFLSFNWHKQGPLEALVDIPLLPLTHPNIKTNTDLHFSFSQKPKTPPEVALIFKINPGQIIIPLPRNKEHIISFQGGEIMGALKNNQLTSTFLFQMNANNVLQGEILSPKGEREPLDTRSIFEQTLQGSMTGEINDLTFLMTLFPFISNLEGVLTLKGDLSGTLKKPTLSVHATTQNASFFIPKQNIKLTQLNLDLAGELPGVLNLMGKGRLGEGTFHLTGYALPFDPEKRNYFELTGQNLCIFNTAALYMIVSPKLMLEFYNRALYVEGPVQILDADINLQDTIPRIKISKDVTFIGLKPEEKIRTPFKIIPNINLKLESKVHFKGYGLEGIVGGKLKIEERSDGLLSGLGRLTIKEGKYRLQGSTRYIHRGRLLFPPGTLLNDPILDIRISERPINAMQNQSDLGIYVQGTLQKPIYQLYSTAQQQNNNEILSRLGLGRIENHNDNEKKRIFSQTAFILGGGANPLLEKIQSGFRLDEFGLTTRESQKELAAPGSEDTALLVGKSLSKRLYLQYIQSIMEPNSTLRLKYFLSPRFTASVETGTELDLGGDLIFSVEKD